MYCNFHKHTMMSNISSLDCISKPEEYMKRAAELGHAEYFTTEHGYQGNIFDVYTLCQKYNLKCVYGVEAYYVDNRHEKDKGNYHIILIAMTENGRKQINKIISEANISGFYYKARIDKELLLTLNPKDVVITTACIQSRLFKGDNWLENFFLPVYNHFGQSLYLEVQNHNSAPQIEHNKKILELSEKYGVKIIHANDSHYIFPEDAEYRALFLHAKGINYGDEDTFILDYPDEETIIDRYHKQGVLNDDQIKAALDNTLIFKQSTGITLDKEFKIPKVTAKDEDSDKVLADIINQAWKKEKENIPTELHEKYVNEIKYEYGMIKKCGMSDYFILDHKVVKKAKEEYGGVLTHTGRGSGVSFYVNKLLGLTEIDRIWCPVKLYPSRFMTDTRILESKSLPDLDMNWSDVEPALKASIDYLGEDGVRQMIAFKPLQVSSAFRLWCKAKGLDIKDYDDVAKMLGDDEHCLDNDPKWSQLVEDSKRFRGVIESVAPSPCSWLLYDKPISEEIGLIAVGSETSNTKVMCCVLDGYNCDCYKYLKNDYLTVTVWEIISEVYKKIGRPIDEIKKLIDLCDDAVWQLLADGITSTINQCDSDYDKQILAKYKPKSFTEMSAYVAAIRPGFASNLESFVNREEHTSGVPELDEILKDSKAYLLYQENLMSLFMWLDIPEKDCYDIIKKISKKKFKENELKEFKERLSKAWLKNVGSLDLFETTWTNVENSAKYSFNASHSVSVGLDSMYGAYLKSHYPMEYYSTVFEIYSTDLRKTTALANELSYFGITLEAPKFRKSGVRYEYDKENKIIYKNIPSIKFLNETVARQLYDMRDQIFDSFIDFLKVNPCDSKQTKILIKLDFFSEFGKSGYLMNIFDLYSARYNTDGSFKKIIKKDNNPYPVEILKKYSAETEKQFRIENEDEFIGSIISTFEDKSLPITEILEAELEYYGYICYTNSKAQNWGYITEINTKYTPKLSVYKLDTGEMITLKISKNDFAMSELKEKTIFKFITEDRPKRKLVDGHWTESDETEPWIKVFRIYSK